MTEIYRPSAEHEEIRQAIRAIVTAKIAPHAAAVDADMRYPQEAHDALVATDFFAPFISVEYGGAGADALATAIIVEEIAAACASSSLIPAVNKLGALPLQLAASDELLQRCFPRIVEGEGISYGLSEREAGSDTASMQTRAQRSAEAWVLNGVKTWITNAGESQFYTVLAVTDPTGRRGNNISAFLVEKGTPGFSFGEKERKLGIKGSPTRELFFENCEIPAENLIGEEGQGLKIALQTLDHSRVTIGAQALGIAQGALDYAIGYIKERQQFGKAIADFQGIQFMVADMGMRLAAARELTYAAAARSDRNDSDLRFFGAAAKAFASDTAMSITTDAVQLLGGAGYVQDHPVERMMRDAKITQIYEGTNQVQRLVMGRTLLA